MPNIIPNSLRPDEVRHVQHEQIIQSCCVVPTAKQKHVTSHFCDAVGSTRRRNTALHSIPEFVT